MRCACIDIGSNTTRLLVADGDGQALHEVHQERAFTRLGRDCGSGGRIGAEKVAEVVEVVSAQLRTARGLGAVDVRAVATAAIRRAANGDALVKAVGEQCGIRVEILSETEEARLAFVGAARSLDHRPGEPLGVVDVGGGSSEVVVGTVPDRVSWSRSFPIGSGDLTDRCLPSDPPTAGEVEAARATVDAVLGGVKPPRAAEALAVGGSATSLRRLAGPLLDESAITRSLALLTAEPATSIASRYGLDVERVRLLPGGLLILQAAAGLLGAPLRIARGGVREGLLLEAGG